MNVKRIFSLLMVLVLIMPSFAFADGTPKESEENPTVSSPAADLRATLSQLLSTHFEYQTLVAIKEFQNAPDLEAVEMQLEQNTQNIGDAIASVYGEEAADQFLEIFAEQYENTSGLAMAVKNDNQEKIEEIKNVLLQEFPKELGTFLSNATGGELPEEAAINAIQVHEQFVLDTFFNYINEDYTAAYESFNDGFNQFYEVGAILAQAIVSQMPDKFNHTEAITPASDLRATLNRLLTLHLDYQVLTAIKQYENAPDLEAVEMQLEQNAQDIANAIASVYGEEAAAQFLEIFLEQYENTSGFAMAVKEDNQEKIEELKNILLDEFPTELGTFFSNATGGIIPADAAADLIRTHEQDVLDIFYDYINEDYQAAYERFDLAEEHITTLGTTLASGIVTQFPDKFDGETVPAEMPDTGFGGTAQSTPFLAWALFAGILTIGGAIAIRRKVLQ
ncbi:hypothetical protein [Planococcus lenghuensis]|uniref:Copper amine oxidase n=1 Tax=Planococcus lenghuensis TaxID=2213202 RepID=A0A1Q2L4A3_9BACL|nr:hypothetical protein [Planococcus lenghuensis]AQQ55269.1 hypothetical protein B0X71_18995 [Planococcus lenghuensis]